MLLLTPAAPAPGGAPPAKKSWYVRAPDADAYDAWRRALGAAAAGADGAPAAPAVKTTKF